MSPDDDFREQMKGFEAEFRETLPEKIRQLDQVWTSLRSEGITRDRLYDLLVRLHSLAGAGRTFGVSRLSETAKAAEACVEKLQRPEQLPELSHLAHLEPLLAAVREAAALQ